MLKPAPCSVVVHLIVLLVVRNSVILSTGTGNLTVDAKIAATALMITELMDVHV